MKISHEDIEERERSGKDRGEWGEGRGGERTRDRYVGRVALFQSKNPFHSTSTPPDTV